MTAQQGDSSLSQREARCTVEDVVRAYRFFLDREPEPEALEGLKPLIAKGGLSFHQLVSHFLLSPEYRAKRGVPSSEAVEVELEGRFLYVRGDDPDIGGVIMATRTYEPHVTPHLLRFLREGQTVVDIGANVGFFTTLAAQRVGPGGRVVAFEPNPANVQLLLRSLVRNQLSNVEVVAAAASDVVDIFTVVAGGSNAYLERPSGHAVSQIHAPSVVLDRWLASEPRIDVVKIDIEGHELRAFDGFRGLLTRHRPVLFTEFHPKALRELGRVDPMDYLERLFSLYGSATVVERDASLVRCESAEAVMRRWEEDNAGAGTGGAMHLDLMLGDGDSGAR